MQHIPSRDVGLVAGTRVGPAELSKPVAPSGHAQHAGTGVLQLGEWHQPIGHVAQVPDSWAGGSGVDVDKSAELVIVVEDHVVGGYVVKADHLGWLVHGNLPNGSGGVEIRAGLVELRQAIARVDQPCSDHTHGGIG